MSKILLTPLKLLYSIATELRNCLYDKKILKSTGLEIPVISVGNITAGGTGKTPFAIALANMLVNREFRPAIITRGYKRKSNGQVIVSKGGGPMVNATESGDEPYLMAKKTAGVVIIANADRVVAGRTAHQQFGCDIIIADDCFQHRQLARDVNILLWDAYSSPVEEKLLPVGRLRESFKHLNRADILVLTRTNNPEQNYIDFFHHFGLECYYSPTKITGISAQNREIDPKFLRNKKFLAFCGLGNHQQFFDTVKTLQPSAMITAKFPDHHKYSDTEMDKIFARSIGENCDFIITTEKDKTNIPENYLNHKNLLILSIELKINQALCDRILSLI